MKILLAVATGVRFTVETPLSEPLGGTESSAAYLLPLLAANGHDVTLATLLPTGTPEWIAGVRHVEAPIIEDSAFFERERFEVVIALSWPGAATHLKAICPTAFHIAWLQMLPDQAAMADFGRAASAIDCTVFVSETQRSVTPYQGRSIVIGNGVSPAFERMFESAGDLLAAKQNKATYTSTPFRGLEYLPDIIEAARAETQYEIYSGMRLYQSTEDDFASLYARLNATPHCHNHGPLSQAGLAERLRSIAFLTYPCTFAETYCISALEAIAAGLKVISTDFGALKETTMGFADLLPLQQGMVWRDMVSPFARLIEKNEAEFLTRPQLWAQQRFEQLQTVNRVCSWRARALEWERLLAGIAALRR